MFFRYSKPNPAFGVASYCFPAVLDGSSASGPDRFRAFGGNDPNLRPHGVGRTLVGDRLLLWESALRLRSCWDTVFSKTLQWLVMICWGFLSHSCLPRPYCKKCGVENSVAVSLVLKPEKKHVISCRCLEPSVKLVQALPLSAAILATFSSEPSNSEGLKNSSHHQTNFTARLPRSSSSHTHVVLHVTGKWDTSMQVDSNPIV